MNNNNNNETTTTTTTTDGKNDSVSMFTLFKNEKLFEISLWIRFYFEIHNIHSFLLFFNADSIPNSLVSGIEEVDCCYHYSNNFIF